MTAQDIAVLIFWVVLALVILFWQYKEMEE
jgi:hypothetical protein